MAENENKRIAELMIPLSEYPYVYDDDTLKDAIGVLEKHRAGQDRMHRSLLVFSRTEKVRGEEKLVGILTIRDFLNAMQKNKYVSDNWVALSTGWANFYHKDSLMESMVLKVGRAVRPLVKAYAQADDTVTKAIEIMMIKKVNIVPVFSDKKVVGIIRAIDILDYISEMLVSNDPVSGDRFQKGRRSSTNSQTPAESKSLWTNLSSLAIGFFEA